MYRNAYPTNTHLDLLIRENQDICMDWSKFYRFILSNKCTIMYELCFMLDVVKLTSSVMQPKFLFPPLAAPHYAMMEIIASSILHSVLAPAVQYRHLCANYQTYTGDGALLQYDWTPIQTVFQEVAMPVDTSICKFDETSDLNLSHTLIRCFIHTLLYRKHTSCTDLGINY